jgi:hypothetical protein
MTKPNIINITPSALEQVKILLEKEANHPLALELA